MASRCDLIEHVQVSEQENGKLSLNIVAGQWTDGSSFEGRQKFIFSNMK